MLNHLRRLIHRLCRRPLDAAPTASVHSDPLSHPDLQKMSLHELADLPFDPARVRERA